MDDEDFDPLVLEALQFSESEPTRVSTPTRVRELDKRIPSSSSAFLLAWKRGKEVLYIEGGVPWGRLPKFVEGYLRLLWDTSEYWAMRAVVVGDVPFFIGWLFRLDQIDNAMLDAGMTLADRSALIRFRASVDGYREVAEKRLKRLGGVWPPGPLPTAARKR